MPTTIDMDLLELIRSRMPSLPASGQQLAETVLRGSDRLVGLSAVQLARVSATSLGSVVRFCQGIGLPGYNAFQLRLAASRTGLHPYVESRPSPASVAERVLICSPGPSQPVAVTLGSSFAHAARTMQYPSDPETQDAVGLIAGAPADAHRSADTASRIVHHALVQALSAEMRA